MEQLIKRPGLNEMDRIIQWDENHLESVREETDKRTRTAKVFSLGGGRYQAHIYPSAVHYLDAKSGCLLEIDNTLITKQDTRGKAFYQNRSNGDMRVTIRAMGADGGIEIENNKGQILKWYIQGAAAVEPHKPSRKTDKDKPGRFDETAERLSDGVVYHSIFEGVNLICRVVSDRFKDEVVYKDREKVLPITFVIDTAGLTAYMDEEGKTVFENPDGETEFILPAPYILDSGTDLGRGSVAVALKYSGESGQYELTYTPDEKWLNQATFPVTLDPAVITHKNPAAIEDNYVCSKQPTTVQPLASNFMRLTHSSSSWGKCNCYYKFVDSYLPDIDSSYYVTKAYFSVMTDNDSLYPTSATPVVLREALSMWYSNTITYNNQPAVSNQVTDGTYMYQYGASTRYAFDISNLVRKWYRGENYGFMLEATGNTYAQLWSSDYSNDNYKPYVQINYVSLAGLESYLSYDSHSIGRAGEGHISLYNGNLIFAHRDTDTTGSLMPVSLTHYYNSCYHTLNLFGCGMGWKSSLNLTLHKETLQSPTEGGGSTATAYYVYMDGDGTRHHFRYQDGKWGDLSGLEMTLTLISGEAIIRDKQDNCIVFPEPTVEFNGNYDNVKQAIRLADALDNRITIAGGLRFTDVLDGAGRGTTAYWGQNLEGYVAPGMYDVAGVGFFYDPQQRLIEISYEDNESNFYTYNSQGLLETAANPDGLTVRYEYYTARAPYRVKSVKVYSGSVITAYREYTYEDMLTIVTDKTVSNGKKLYYHFNDYGNLVAVRDELGYSAFTKYSPSLPINHPEAISKLQKTVHNLLGNHGFEEDGVWRQNYNGGIGSYAYDTGTKYLGTRSLKMQKTNDTGNMHIAQTVTCVKGKTYAASIYARGDSAMGITFALSYTNSSGSTQWVNSEIFAVSGEWERKSFTFTLPQNAGGTDVNVCVCGVNGPGNLWLDAAQWEENVVASRYNLLENGDFSQGVTGWTFSGAGAEDTVTAIYTGVKPQDLSANTLYLTGSGYDTEKKVYQELAQSGAKGDMYVAGGWSSAQSIPRWGNKNRYGLIVSFQNASTGAWEDAEPVEWSEEWSGWHMAAGPVSAPNAYSRIRFNLMYSGNYNSAQFDGLFLHKEEFGESFQYDSKGNLLASKDLAGLKDNAVYDAFNNLTSYRQPGRTEAVKTLLEYGATDAEKKKHLLRKSTSPLGTVSEYTYDNKGNALSAKTGGNELFVQSQTTYSANQNDAVSRTDARGKTTASDIDPKLGILHSVTDPMGQKVNYTYDIMKRIKTVKAAADGKTYQNAYTYDKDKLKTVSHNTGSDTVNDVTYTFGYDTAGRPTNVKVGSQTLSTTAYNTDTTVAGATYGNGGKVHYSYDAFKRVTGLRYDDEASDRYSYDYGVHGEIARVTDSVLNRQASSEYDLANRPMRITHREGTAHLYTGEVKYDVYSNLQAFKEKVGPNQTPYETTFAYDNENRPTTLSYGSAANKAAYTYDVLGRITQKTLTVGGRAYETGYEYEAGGHGPGSTTPLVKTLTQNGKTLTYAYDDTGNILSVESHGTEPPVGPGDYITEITDEAGEPLYAPEDPTNRLCALVEVPAPPIPDTKVTYTYDRLGQLIRTNDPYDTEAGALGTTWVYTYDRGGNILTKTAYAYTTEAPGAVIQTISYTYGDSNWKDKLTAYNGTPISYDAIGNPLNDGTWTYTWQAGRQLKSMTKPGTNISYAYNADGLRVQKTVNGTATNYTLHGKHIVHMVQGSNTLHFYYDAQSRPSVVDFNGVKYGYLHNLQGDIISIVDQNGNTVVEYRYDPWGKPLHKAGSLASTLGTLNPFRYRGYVYDEETGLYATATRYYNPVWGRFINADSVLGNPGSLLSHNAFTYCVNSPVNRADHSGTTSILLIASLWATNAAMIAIHSFANRDNPKAVTVDQFMQKLDDIATKGTDVRARNADGSITDTGCASYIARGLPFGASHTGMTSIFWGKPSSQDPKYAGKKQSKIANVIFWGTIDSVGGPGGLIRGMILGESIGASVKHGGVYAGLHDFGDGQGSIPAVYSFSTKTHKANLRPYNPEEWDIYGWHEAVIFPQQ